LIIRKGIGETKELNEQVMLLEAAKSRSASGKDSYRFMSISCINLTKKKLKFDPKKEGQLTIVM